MEIPARRLVFRVHAAAIRFDSSPSETSSNQLPAPLPPPHVPPPLPLPPAFPELQIE